MHKRNEYFSDTGLLLRMFPVSYALHIMEEWWAGFPEHLLRTQGILLTPGRFMGLQITGLGLMVAGVTMCRKLLFPFQMLVILGTIVIGNLTAHAIRTIFFKSYDPGLLTAITFWLPLGTLALRHAWPRTKMSRYLISSATGLAICSIVELMTSLSDPWS